MLFDLSAAGEIASGATTLVDPPSPPKELHEVPLPPDPLPELPGFPGISEFSQRVAEVHRRVEAHKWELREGLSSLPPPTPQLSLIA